VKSAEKTAQFKKEGIIEYSKNITTKVKIVLNQLENKIIRNQPNIPVVAIGGFLDCEIFSIVIIFP